MKTNDNSDNQQVTALHLRAYAVAAENLDLIAKHQAMLLKPERFDPDPSPVSAHIEPILSGTYDQKPNQYWNWLQAHVDASVIPSSIETLLDDINAPVPDAATMTDILGAICHAVNTSTESVQTTRPPPLRPPTRRTQRRKAQRNQTRSSRAKQRRPGNPRRPGAQALPGPTQRLQPGRGPTPRTHKRHRGTTIRPQSRPDHRHPTQRPTRSHHGYRVPHRHQHRRPHNQRTRAGQFPGDSLPVPPRPGDATHRPRHDERQHGASRRHPPAHTQCNSAGRQHPAGRQS